MGLFDRDPDGDDGESIADQLEDRASPSPTERVQDRDCDECGTTEGSVVADKEDGWALCRSCYNDPDVLAEYMGD